MLDILLGKSEEEVEETPSLDSVKPVKKIKAKAAASI
jgi:hypothetical protein